MAKYPATSNCSSRLWNVLLVIPFVALLWVPFYISSNRLCGHPFFLLVSFPRVFLTSALIIWVHHKSD